MATIKELEARVAQLEDTVALLSKFSPQAAAAKREAARVAQLARVRGVATLDEYDALPAADRSAFRSTATIEQLVEMLRPATSEDRARVLDGLAWRAKAAVHFALAPAPALTEVTCTSAVGCRPLGLNEGEAGRLRLAGVVVRDRQRTSASEPVATLPAFEMRAGDRKVLDADAWAARRDFSETLSTAVADGKLVERRLTDDEARAHALEAYCMAYGDAQSSASGPELPEI